MAASELLSGQGALPDGAGTRTPQPMEHPASTTGAQLVPPGWRLASWREIRQRAHRYRRSVRRTAEGSQLPTRLIDIVDPRYGSGRRQVRPGRPRAPCDSRFEERGFLAGVQPRHHRLDAEVPSLGSYLTIQFTPNRSVHMPKPAPPTAFSNGMVICPPSDSMSKILRAPSVL